MTKEVKSELGGTKNASLKIRETTVDQVTVLSFDGVLDTPNLAKAKKVLAEKLATATASPRFVIDLENVSFIDSSGLGFFVGSLKKVRDAKGDLKLANLNAYMLGIFRIINLNYIIDCYDSVDRAVASFSVS